MKKRNRQLDVYPIANSPKLSEHLEKVFKFN